MNPLKIPMVVFLSCATLLLAEGSPFLNAGMPAADREWLGSDYMTASKLLQSGKSPKPLLTDEAGRELFARITHQDNLQYYRNKNIPIFIRFQDFIQLQQSLNIILMTYAVAANQGEDLNEEVVQLMSFTLYVAALGVDLINEFLPTFPRDETYETRMQGLKIMYSGLTKIFGGAEFSLNETDFYSAEDLHILLKAMDANLPKISQAFSEGYRKELQIKLKNHMRNFTGEDLKLLQSMSQTLQPKVDAGE